MKKQWMPGNGIVFCIFLLCCPTLLWSQTTERDTVVQKRYRLRGIDVKSQRSPKNIKSSAPTQQLSEKDFSQQGITDLADAVRRFSGITLKDYGGAGGLKTVSVRCLGAQHTAITYDGMMVADCQSGQIDLSRFTLDQLQSLSLTIGDNDDIFLPARTIAAAASLHLKTHIPDLQEKSHQLKTVFKVGSFGMVNPVIRYDQRLTKNSSFSLSGDFMRADNLYPFTLQNGKYSSRERRNNNYLENWRVEGNLYAKPGKHSTLQAKIYYYDSFRELPGQVILYNNDNQEELKEQNFFSQVHYRSWWSNGISIQLNGKFNWAYSGYHDEAPEYPDGEMNNSYYQREYYGSAALLYVPHQAWSLSYAADYAYGKLNSNALSGIKPFRQTILQSLTGRYRTDRFTATALLLGSIYLNDTQNGAAAGDAKRLSPSFSCSWQPFSEQEFYLRASYKDIFRVATFTENYFDRWGSRDLKPENTRQYNLGVTYSATRRGSWSHFQATVDGYYNQVKNKIVAMPYNMFFWTMVNLGKVEIWGTDLTTESVFQLAPRHQLLTTISYTYQHAVDRTDPSSSYYNDQIPYTPKHSGSFALNWENPWVNLSFHATGTDKRYSSMQNMKANEVKGYIECGLTFYRSFQGETCNWSLRGDLINLGDKQYDVVKNYPMPGRSCKLTLCLTL